MKYLPSVFVAIAIALTSCGSNGTSVRSENKDSLQLVVDSYRNTDIMLSFKGLKVGDSLSIDSNGLYGDSIKLYPIDEYTYQGCVSIPYMDGDGKKRTEFPNIHVDVLKGRIAKISILSESWGLCKFFIETFNDRYYKKEPVESGGLGRYNETYFWTFKTQSIIINRKYHLDPQHRIYHITDSVLIAYAHDAMAKTLDCIFTKRDSLKRDENRKRIENETKQLRENI